MSSGPSQPLGAYYAAVRGCEGCHRSGDTRFGSYSGNERVSGSNLTPDPDTGIGRWSDDQIIAAMRDSFDPTGRMLCVKHYADMGQLEFLSILSFLHSLPAVHHEIPPATCP